MSKTMPAINDIVSLTIMLLLIVALVAAQASATDYQAAVSNLERAEAIAAQDPPVIANAAATLRNR